MALTIAQFTAFCTIVPTVTGSNLGIRRGYQITNGSRAGEAMIVECTPSGFAPNIWASFYVAVISGSFQAGDSCTTSNGGSFTVSTATSAAHPGIQVTGTMSDTNSTINTNAALDATEEEIAVTPAPNDVTITTGDILRIENEYLLCLWSYEDIFGDPTTYIICKRGLFGTAATHTSGQDIHVVDTDLYEQMLDADVSGGWGYSTSSNGRIELDCHLLLGKTDISSINILLSANEIVDISATSTNTWDTFGNYTNYKTHIQHGRGFISGEEGNYEGFGAKGTILISAKTAAYEIRTNPRTETHFYNSQIDGCFGFQGTIFGWNFNSTSFGDSSQFNMPTGEDSKMYNLFMSLVPVNFATGVLDLGGMFQYSRGLDAYWISNYADATISNWISNEDTMRVMGFLGNATKTLIDCKCNATTNVVWGSGRNLSYKTFNCTVRDEQGNLIDGATVTCNYRLASTANIFTEQTTDGVIDAQNVLFRNYLFAGGSPTDVQTRDIEYFIYKAGYKEVRGRINIQDRDDPIKLFPVLKKNRFRETKSRGGL